jgi:cysteine desulfurase
LINLDHNAGAPLDPAVARAMGTWLDGRQANPSSAHARGQAARMAIEEARLTVSDAVGCRPGEVIFVGSGTEACATALAGVALARRRQARRVLVSAIEHEAVLNAARFLANLGFDVVEVPCERDGRVEARRFVDLARGRDTAVAALILASNETGVRQPVEEAARELRAREVPLLTDAVQAVGRIPFSFGDLGADLLAISGHKFGGPQGVGALIIRHHTPFEPLVGGAQEGGRRGGTEAVAAIVGLGRAAALLPLRLQAMARVAALRDRLEAAIGDRIPEVEVHGHTAPRVANTVSVGFGEVDAAALVAALDLAGLAVSRGSACRSGAEEPSHVIRAMGVPERWARGTVRLSLGVETTEQEISEAVRILVEVVDRVRRNGPVRS